METTKPHISILPTPGLGHIIPLLEFAKKLVTYHGFRVSFLAITTNESSAAKEQLFQSPMFSPGLDIVQLPPVDVSAIINDDMLILTRISLIIQESLKCLKSLLIELGKPKALVIDLFTTQAFDVCEELSIPVYSFFTSPIALLTFSLYLPTLDRDLESESQFVDLPEPVTPPGCTPVRIEDLIEPIKDRKNDESKWYLLHVSRLPLAAGIVLNSWEDLEPVALKALTENSFYKQIPTPPVYPIGPLIKEEESPILSDSETLAWLDKQPHDSVLYVALGSGGTLTAEQFTELAWGLELSQQRFLMVARKPIDGSASATFFNVGSDVNDPMAYLPEGFLERTEGRGLVVPSWAPQIAVLKHPATGGFLSHCGWNSALESLSCGVPMIAWPLYAEQRMNATILSEEVGVAIKPAVAEGKKIVERGDIERVVKVVMEGEEGKKMKERAGKLKESASKALDINGPSYDSLARLAQQWKADDFIFTKYTQINYSGADMAHEN
ncbi:hydroquinone glucosyltransferase-like [Euphorbia lathyris]|uniref:hydroquinone glucosyltransferase-like n=1 Tax=Euphorbia lathyris TaxID=212925 RepID=UPI003313FC63